MRVLHAESHALTGMMELPAPAVSRADVAVVETTQVVRAIEPLFTIERQSQKRRLVSTGTLLAKRCTKRLCRCPGLFLA
jgi:hypothetical protein